MINYVEDGGVTIPASRTDSAQTRLSELEKALQDVANPLGLAIERTGRKDDATHYNVYIENKKEKTKGIFRKKTVQYTEKEDVGTMFLGLTPINGHIGSKDKAPVYLVSAAKSEYYGGFFGTWSDRSKYFPELKKFGSAIHQTLGNDVMLDTEETWDNRLREGFTTKITDPTRTCEYCGLGTAGNVPCEHCGAPSPNV